MSDNDLSHRLPELRVLANREAFAFVLAEIARCGSDVQAARFTEKLIADAGKMGSFSKAMCALRKKAGRTF